MRGVAFWTEVSVARRAVDAVFGPPTIRSETVFTETPAASPALAPVPAPAPNTQSLGSDACNIHSKAFLDCINSNENEISKCHLNINSLKL
ncbi:p8MTCP1, putative [Medicago truncatula]|uniref:P8MTCP1, putative n=1 Tax=Medicago truncatula TaxID=3880 RepID=G7IS68_MEDTR|nr:p8MTCP1, putative [Medicago truncatula]